MNVHIHLDSLRFPGGPCLCAILLYNGSHINPEGSTMSADVSLADVTGVQLAGHGSATRGLPGRDRRKFLRAVEASEPIVNAFVTVCHDQALTAAREAADAVLRTDPSELPTLHGIPVAVKDLTPTAGVRTTFGSRHFADHVPTEDGLIWQRLTAAGAILLGKTTTPEFGMHSITESPLTGITNNPWDPTRTVGGSSGGSAAALAARMTPLATGSDGGGSIRVPSSFCGTVGLKCSRGRIPIWSEGDPFETVDVVGPMTRTVADTALMLDICAGPHPYDPFALPDEPRHYLAAATNADVRGLRIAFCPDLGNPPIEPAITEALVTQHGPSSRLEHVSRLIPISLPDPMEYFLALVGAIRQDDARGPGARPDRR